MKHCYHCGRVTAGDPIFCNSCGRSFDRKLCPRLHPNPRSAEVCSRCGSWELSAPQPRVSFGWRIVELLLRFVAGALLTVLSIFFALALLNALLQTPQVQAGL